MITKKLKIIKVADQSRVKPAKDAKFTRTTFEISLYIKRYLYHFKNSNKFRIVQKRRF